MAHEIDFSNNRANVAFLGSRNDIWHRLGTEMEEGMSVADWAKAAGLDWHAVKVPAWADLRDMPTLSGMNLRRTGEDPTGMLRAPARQFVVRSDTGAMLGDNLVSDVYVPHQPREVLDWFERYISVDERFQLDTAGSLKGGSTIWAMAKFRDPLDIAGDRHVARVLMTTTFDGSGATINQASMTRVVCNNTLTAAMFERKARVATRHNTKFDAARVGKELAQIAGGFAEYKKMGDAMAQVEMAADQVKVYFKQVLDIPLEAKQDDISTRKLNQFRALSLCLSTTKRERNSSQPNGTADAWTALNAITRWVDHDRVSENGDGGEKQFTSAQFGSGAAVKEKAVALLLPLIRDKVAA